MPFKIHGITYVPTKRNGRKKDYSTFRFKESKNGNAVLFFGKLKRPKRSKTGKLQRWKVYEVLTPV